MFLSILNTVYQIVFLIFAIYLFIGCISVAIDELRKRKESYRAEVKPVEIKGPALDVIGEACEEICDNYCKFREAYAEDGYEFPPQCDNCPLGKIL